MDLTIRTISGEDNCKRASKLIAPLWVANFSSTPFFYNYSIEDALRDLNQTFSNPKPFVLLAYEGAKLVFAEGGSEFNPEISTKYRIPECADVSFAVVEPKNQNRGLQTKLRSVIFNFLKDEMGFDNLLIMVPHSEKPDGTPLSTHFSKIGYQFVDSFTNEITGKSFDYLKLDLHNFKPTN